MIEKINKWLPILTALAVVVMAVMLVGGNSQPESLGATRFGHGIALTGASDTFTLGSSGTEMSAMLTGTCDLFSSGDTISATSSVIASCLATGVTAGDKVFVQLATSTAGNADQYAVVGASASSSADFIAVQLLNLSGGASQTTKAGTSTQFWVVR